MHLLSLERMQDFKTVTLVDIQLNETAREMRERKERKRSENRHIVGVIFDIVRHLAKQNVAFRGQDETSSSKNILSDNQLSLMALVGKGFDGAANMSGKDEGVQQHLFDAGAELSVYFHCFAHRLNLVLEHSVENVSTVKTVFETIGDFYRFMDGFPKRHALYNEHLKQQQITSGKTALHALFDTRWTARSDNLDTIMNVYPALLSMFQQMSHGVNGTATG